jgi:hypothetical protein
MIQVWADLLDDLAAGKVVVPTNDLLRSSATPLQSRASGNSAAGIESEKGLRVPA